MSNESRDEVLEQLGELRELRQLSTSNYEQDTAFVELLKNDDFLERLYLYLAFRIKREYQWLISLIESNLINKKITSIVSILEAANQKVIELIKLNSTEENTSIVSKVELVHKKLIELAKLLIKRDIDAQNEVNIVLKIEEQYLQLVELVKSNLAESNKISVIFVIKVTYGTIIEDIYYPLQGNSKSNFAATIETQYQSLIELMELNLIEKNSKVFVSIIKEKYYQVLDENSPPITIAGSTPTIKLLYREIWKGQSGLIPTSKTLYGDTIITDKNIKNDSHSIVKGIFLYTDGDSEIVDYMMNNFEDFDELTGEWCYIYVLEKKGINWKLLIKYWKYLLLSKLHEIFKPIRLFTKKPFNRKESYKIARDLGIPIEQLPCIVFLPPLTEISGQEKLVIPVKEASTKYFRKVFSTLEGIVNQAKVQNRYEAIKVKFDDIIQYLEKNSEKVFQQTTTEYQINGTNIFVNSEIRRLKMTEENNPSIRIGDSANIVGITGQGNINTATQNQYNYPPEQKQNLAEAAKEIQQLLQQLSKPNYSATPTENAIIVGEVMQEIEKNPSLKSRIIEGLKQGGKEAFKELINHPAVNILIATIDGWNNAE
ncbi:MAG: hypothetical protein F6K54_05235 [Okeania sp. SIO3B5]|uniref:hypothetical protein n=1 Tax=Okeania sp. SIO3B5 TaxID=2607811 RepID=UPI0014018649|nr:hypothetical protein [Okeania sp. SIO3B5]NEO52523.1 hypothetical protein [Okeania sp. SIO3B5]